MVTKKYSNLSVEENVHESALLAAELDEALASAEEAVRLDDDLMAAVKRLQKSAAKK